ncbi:MAG: glutamate--cysteine ligase [Gammaproteobacteria bacterium]
MAISHLKENLERIGSEGFFDDLKISRGIERESLRIGTDKKISNKSHPASLGSSLCSDEITTDFAEALLELVTPTFDSRNELYKYLYDLHHFVNTKIGDEVLWNFSMPCAFASANEIRLAEYGTSNQGKIKNIYRRGLKERYGSIMQCVSGIHYNFSLSQLSLERLLTALPSKQDKNELYLGAIRNIKRMAPFLLAFFGASPVCHNSYLFGRSHNLMPKGDDLYLPNATSLRMSKIGYQSPVQEELHISYNDLNSFIDALVYGITTPHPLFTKIGLLDKDGYPQQISDGILQIENELYDIVRPKRKGNKLDRPVELLKNKGISYLEIRGIDINPFDPAGISESQIALLDAFLLLCLIKESEKTSNKELQENIHNQELVVGFGRDPNLKISSRGQSVLLKDQFAMLKDELLMVSDYVKDNDLANAVQNHFENPFISERVLEIATNREFTDVAYEHSIKIKDSFQKDYEDKNGFEKRAAKSIDIFKVLGAGDETDIKEFVNLYNDKIKEMR